MALSTRQELTDYCLRRLGFPVIEINVDEDQVNDRIDDALQYWQEYHFDGVLRTYIQHQITGSIVGLYANQAANFTVGETITGATSGATTRIIAKGSSTLTVENTQGTFVVSENVTGDNSGYTSHLASSSFFTQGDMDKKYIPIGNGVLGIIRMFNFGGASNGTSQNGNNIFDLMYQFRQNDMYNLLGADMSYYAMAQTHLSTLEQLLISQRQIRWNRKTNKLFIDTDWDTTFNPGDWVVAEAYTIVNPDDYAEVYDDMFLKKYATALIKRQWGENMKKFGGVQLPGGVTLNGDQIFQEALVEIDKIEADMQTRYMLPPAFMVG